MRYVHSLNNVLQFVPTENIVSQEKNSCIKSVKIIEFEGAGIECFYSIEGDEMVIKSRFWTPLGNAQFETVKLSSKNPSAVISGGNVGYKAKIYAELNNQKLKLNGMICIPFYECEIGNAEINIE